MSKGDAEACDQGISLYVPQSLLDAINDFRRREIDLPGLSEAIRRLIQRGLHAGDA